MDNFDIIIVGGGVIGLSTGYRAQKAGAKVLVIDRGGVGYEASSRAEGFLSLRGETPEESPLAQMSERLWLTLDEELGYTTEWTQKGRIWPAFAESEVERLKIKYASFQQTDIAFEYLEGEECRKLVPNLSTNVQAAIYTNRSGHANPQRLVQAFAWAFQDCGGTILEHTPVYSVTEQAGKVRGVQTAGGAIGAGTVILCAGGYNAKLLQQVGVVFPTAPFRVESFVTAPMPHMFDMCLVGRGISVRQTKRGNFHVQGGPYEWVDLAADKEPAKPVTSVVCGIARRFMDVFPIARTAQIIRTWGGITDTTPDQMVIIEKLSSPDGLIATCGAGHGFGMAPILGVVLSDLALKGETDAPIRGLGLGRFNNLAENWRQDMGWQAGAYNR